MDEVAGRGTLGKSDHILFLISVETKAEYRHTCTLGFIKANFNKPRTMIIKAPWQEMVTEKGIQNGWGFLLKKDILKTQLQTISTKKMWNKK